MSDVANGQVNAFLLCLLFLFASQNLFATPLADVRI
jgi:hypothetical protein